MKNFLENLIENLNEINTLDFATLTCGGNGVPSVTITGGKKVTKTISFTKVLSEKLALEDTVDILLLNKGSIIIGKSLDVEQAKSFELCNDDGKKIIYSAGLVQVLTKVASLDFTARTSYSFREVKFDDVDGKTIATVDLTEPFNVKKMSSVSHEEEQNA